MKRTFKLIAIAAMALSLGVACGNNTEEPADTTPVEDSVIEEVAEDTVAIDTVAEETPAQPAKQTAKKTTSKKTTTKEQGVDASKAKITEQNVTVSSKDIKVSEKNGQGVDASKGGLVMDGGVM